MLLAEFDESPWVDKVGKMTAYFQIKITFTLSVNSACEYDFKTYQSNMERFFDSLEKDISD